MSQWTKKRRKKNTLTKKFFCLFFVLDNHKHTLGGNVHTQVLPQHTHKTQHSGSNKQFYILYCFHKQRPTYRMRYGVTCTDNIACTGNHRPTTGMGVGGLLQHISVGFFFFFA